MVTFVFKNLGLDSHSEAESKRSKFYQAIGKSLNLPTIRRKVMKSAAELSEIAHRAVATRRKNALAKAKRLSAIAHRAVATRRKNALAKS
jgi:hypothetical protein